MPSPRNQHDHFPTVLPPQASARILQDIFTGSHSLASQVDGSTRTATMVRSFTTSSSTCPLWASNKIGDKGITPLGLAARMLARPICVGGEHPPAAAYSAADSSAGVWAAVAGPVQACRAADSPVEALRVAGNSPVPGGTRPTPALGSHASTCTEHRPCCSAAAARRKSDRQCGHSPSCQKPVRSPHRSRHPGPLGRSLNR